MFRFIYHTIRQMLNYTYLSLIFLYSVLSWLITEISYTQKGILSIHEVIAQYNMIIMSLLMINSIYFIISHFRETLNGKMRDITLVRLGSTKYFWGLISSYILYVVMFNVIPLYAVSLFQLYQQNVSDIQYFDYLHAIAEISIKIGVWPVILSIIIYIGIKNDLLALITWSIVYFVISGIIFMFDVSQGDIAGFPPVSSPFLINVLLSLAHLIPAIIIGRNITNYSYSEKISGGVFSFIAKKLKCELSAFHYKMLGYKTQSLYLFLGVSGIVFILNLASALEASSNVIAKIFFGVFFPLLFSLNQYNLIAVDIESGMIVANVLRKKNYAVVVLNRWLTMLVPQIVFAAIFSYIIFSSIDEAYVLLIIFVILLNIFFNSMNLFLSVFFNKSAYANIVIGFISYLLLREDVQEIITSNNILNSMNFLESITSFTNNSPAAGHILILFVLTIIAILAARQKLMKMQNNLAEIVF